MILVHLFGPNRQLDCKQRNGKWKQEDFEVGLPRLARCMRVVSYPMAAFGVY